jgi:integrase
VYTFVRVSAVVTMKVRDYRAGGWRADIHLQEKGAVVNRVPVHHKLREFLDEYIEAAKLAKAPESWLWRSMPGRKDDLSEKPMSRHDAFQVVKRRCATANLPDRRSCGSSLIRCRR